MNTRPGRMVVLMGLRASGKSTVGRLLSARLGGAGEGGEGNGSGFVDLDDRTAARLGVASTAEGLRNFGEPRFREAEAAALAEALALAGPDRPRVLSLGGGTPMHPESRVRLLAAQESGAIKLIYLRAEAATLAARLTGQEGLGRPSLTGKGTVEEIPVLLAMRDPVYRQLAEVVIQVEGLGPEAIVERLAAAIGPAQPSSS